MTKDYFRDLNRLADILYLNMNFKNHLEFERKYLLLSLQRGKIFTWFICIMSFLNFYLDFTLYQDLSVDFIYRRNLFGMHIIGFLLSIAYLAGYKLIEKKNLQNPCMAKALIRSEICIIIFFGSLLSLNSQRFTGNINAYIMIVLVGGLIIPIYPRWMLSVYAINHVFFLMGLSHMCMDNSVFLKQGNATTTILVAMVLFLLLYRSNVTNFLNEEMLREDKQTFIKLFEANPFPLLISRFEDGEIQYANNKAVSFYELPKEIPHGLRHVHLFKNTQDFESICKRFETERKITDCFVEQKTWSGRTKHTVVSYEIIDYFGEKSILSGIADIGEIRRIEKELTLHVSTDPLTGVLNRRAGMNLLQTRFEDARRGQAGLSLCFFDVDRLKTVNDTFGHLEGDAMIVDVCRIITQELQQDDVIFRYGGDEFIILFTDKCEQEVRTLCARIVQQFEALNQSKQKPYWIGASFGVFSYEYQPEANLSLEQIIEMADRDMYCSKAKKAAPTAQNAPNGQSTAH